MQFYFLIAVFLEALLPIATRAIQVIFFTFINVVIFGSVQKGPFFGWHAHRRWKMYLFQWLQSCCMCNRVLDFDRGDFSAR
mmetsp:Transcript_1909/g.11722  ORF Transcript_1909/g.11722 Transcript_1909/m.11722 type:complete len:81 (+) Transcript_1909:1931-2173(+)